MTLCQAAADNNINLLRQLLDGSNKTGTAQHGVDTAKHKHNPNTPDLTWTCQRTPSALFANAGDSYNTQNNGGVIDTYAAYPLHIAILAGHVEAVQILLEAGADVNQLDGLGRTVLHCALFGQDITEGAAANRMYLSLEHPSHLTILREHLLCHPQLSRVTRETPATAAMNMTPLGLAAFLGKPRTVELLLTTRPPVAVDGRDSERRTALMHAVTNGKREVTHVLLRHGASVLAVDQQGRNVVALAEKAANGPQATAAHSSLHKLCQETAQKQQLQRARMPPSPPAIPPPPSTTPPETLLRQSAVAAVAASAVAVTASSKIAMTNCHNNSLGGGGGTEVRGHTQRHTHMDEELRRLTDDFPLPPSTPPSFSPVIQPTTIDEPIPALINNTDIEKMPRAVADTRTSEAVPRRPGHTRSSTATSSQLRFSLLQSNSSTVYVEGEVPHGSPLPRSPPPRLHITLQGKEGLVSDNSETSSLAPRNLHRRFQSHDDRSRVGGDLTRRLTDPAVTTTTTTHRQQYGATLHGHPANHNLQFSTATEATTSCEITSTNEFANQDMSSGVRISLTAVGQNETPLSSALPANTTTSGQISRSNSNSSTERSIPVATRGNIRNTFGQAPTDSIEELVMLADSLAERNMGKNRLSVYNANEEHSLDDDDDGHYDANGPTNAIASTDENETDGGVDRRRRNRLVIPEQPMPETSSELIKQQLQQSQSQSTSTKSTSRRRSKRRRRLHRQRHVRSINETGGATIDAGLRLQLEIRQENVNEIQVDIQNLKKQEMRAAQALRLAEDEVAYSPDQETQTRLKRAKDGHERIHRALTQLLCDREVQCRFIDQLEQKIRRQERDNADTVSSDSLTADESSRHQARTNDMLTSNDDGDDDSNSEGSGSDTAADDAMLATPLASNIDEQRIMQLERKIRIQREEADEREEALEVQLRSSHEHWRKAEQRLKQEQTNASTQIAQLHERLKGDANRQTQVLQHAEALAEPWQLELPDGHRIYMAAASPSSSDHEGDDDPLNTMNDIDNDKADGNDENVEDATGATVNVRQHRQRRILRALNRARWQRDHLAEHLETYAQELRVQRERNEKLVRVVLEQVRKKLMDEDSTGDLDSAMSMFSRQLDATLNHTALGVSTGLGNGITINGGGGGSNSINGHQPNTHRRRGSSSSVSTSASFRSMPTFGGYFDDPTGQLALNGSTRRPRPRLMAASSSTGNALLRSPNPRLQQRDLTESIAMRRSSSNIELGQSSSDANQSPLSWVSSADTFVSDSMMSPLDSATSVLSGTTDSALHSADADGNACYSGNSSPSMARSRSYNSDIEVKPRVSITMDKFGENKLDLGLLTPSSMMNATPSMVENELHERSSTLTELDTLRMQLRQQQQQQQQKQQQKSVNSSTATHRGHRVTASETDASLADQISSGVSDTGIETRRMSMLVSSNMNTVNGMTSSATRQNRLRHVRTPDDLHASAKLWAEAARRRGDDPVVAESLERLTRLRAEITILEKTVLQANRSVTSRQSVVDPSSEMHNKMSLVLTRKRKEYMNKMRTLSELCGQPLATES